MKVFRIRRAAFFLIAVSFFACMVIGIYFITRDFDHFEESAHNDWLDTKPSSNEARFGVGGSNLLQKLRQEIKSNELLNIVNPEESKVLNHETKFESKFNNSELSQKEPKPEREIGESEFNNLPEPNYNVHIFYYAWYGNPQLDGKFYHWAHERLPHWDPKIAAKFSKESHVPPDDIGSNFYPALGPYSSQDPTVIDAHMQQIRKSGAGVLAVSWYPPGYSDDNGTPWDRLMPKLLDTADRYQLKICFHIEPFKGRSATTIRQWLTYIMDTYSHHPAFYRFSWKGRNLPLYYLYDSYQVSNDEWQALFQADSGSLSVRNTRLDGHFIGLLVERKHQKELHQAGFDGYYTYFASNGFSYGSSTLHWSALAREATGQGRLFIPSVGPGYIDVQVRPWNKQNTKERNNGRYYNESFEAALNCDAPLISITSFNEWHEGTQIEEAVPKQTNEYKYLDYSPNTPDYYIQLTRTWVDKFRRRQRKE